MIRIYPARREGGGKRGNLGSPLYEKAFEEFQESYEPWPQMRRRMALKEKEKKTKS